MAKPRITVGGHCKVHGERCEFIILLPRIDYIFGIIQFTMSRDEGICRYIFAAEFIDQNKILEYQ